MNGIGYEENTCVLERSWKYLEKVKKIESFWLIRKLWWISL
jgi:hypothetical protein